MKTTKSIIKAAILIALAVTAILGIFSVPTEENLLQWFAHLLASKAVGFSALYNLCRLCTIWNIQLPDIHE